MRRLIAAQFPHWGALAIAPVEPGGWDNRTFRLGDQLCVRLPSAERYAAQVEKEQCWLPRLAPLLPLPVPSVVAVGAPAAGYPWRWSVRRWIEGESASALCSADLGELATALAGFLTALQRIDPSDGPPPGQHNFFRGGPLAIYDAETRDAITALRGQIDDAAATRAWESALASTWRSAPVWIHGDIAAGNLLVSGGRLSAVIDFGCMGVGDPACDLTIAWTLFSGGSREVFRAALPLDLATWARARGWALWKALITLAAPRPASPLEADEARRTLDAVLADPERSA